MSKYYTYDVILSLISLNPLYSDIIEEISLIKDRNEKATKALLDKVPDRYVDLYPYARTIKRNFILHIGPTNSGKTYEAVEVLKKAKNGIYLAPLRLLAYEQY